MAHVGLLAYLLVLALIAGFRHRASAAGRSAARLALAALPVVVGSLVIEWVLLRGTPADAYRIEPLPGSAAGDPFVAGKPGVPPKWTYAPGFRGRFVHPQYDGQTFEVNADGFRDRAWPAAPGGDAPRVLALGDSCTVGYGVQREQAWPARLEARLRAQGLEDARVLNGAVAGYGPADELLTYWNWRDRLRPDVVVVGFYDGNDFEDLRLSWVLARHARLHGAMLDSERARAAGAPPPARLPRGADDPRRAGMSSWRLLFGWRTRQEIDRCWRQLRVRFFGDPPAAVYNERLLRSMVATEPDLETREDVELTLLSLRTLDALVRERGGRLLVLRIPARVQTSEAQWNALCRDLGLDAGAYDRTLPGRLVVERLRAEGIAAADALPALEAKPGTPSPYYAEGHPNAEGHERLAAVVAEALDAMEARSATDLPRAR